MISNNTGSRVGRQVNINVKPSWDINGRRNSRGSFGAPKAPKA